MTYSQLVYFGRAIALGDIERREMDLAIAHNPYAAKEKDARALPDALSAQRRRLEGPVISLAPREPAPRSAPPRSPQGDKVGIPLLQLLAAMGGAWTEENGKPRRLSGREVLERIGGGGTRQHD